MHRRRFKVPVISRLALAWFGAAGAVAAVAAGFYQAAVSDEGFGRIALPVDRLEVMARAPQEERLEAPSTAAARLAPEEPQAFVFADGEEAEDQLTVIYPGEDGLSGEDGLAVEDELVIEDDGFEEFSAGEVVIRIPGQNKAATSVQTASLTPAARPIPDPDPAMLQSTPLGKIPRVAPDGRRAVHYYAKPFEGARSGPRVAIIVGGLGLNSAITERAIDELPAEVSLSFAPYAKNLEFWTEKARRAGHEVLVELPMEGYGPNNQALGAAALLSSRTAEENLQRLDWLMSRFGGYVAATNYMGAKFTADDAAITPVLRKLKDAGVGYIDDTGAARRAGDAIGLPMASVSRMIPAAADSGALGRIRRELAALEQEAERNGSAVGKTYAYATTIDEIAAWSKTLEKKGIAHAPASALLRSRAVTR